MYPPPLLPDRYLRLRTRDIDQMRSVTAANLADSTLELMGPAVEFDGQLLSVDLGACSLYYFTYGTEVLSTPGSMENFFCVHAVDCELRYENGGSRIKLSPSQGMVTSPTRPIRLWQTATSHDYVLTIPRAHVEEHLTALMGERIRGPIEFEPRLPTEQGVGAALRAMIRYLTMRLQQDEHLCRQPLILANLAESVISTLLTCQPHNYSCLLETRSGPAPQRTVREAEEYLLIHAAEPVTIAHVANALDVSFRALDRAFRRHRGYGPKTFLQSVRLDRARARLMSSRPADRVTNIAMECGFGHIGRFSVAYRRRYGESPSETLARHFVGS